MGNRAVVLGIVLGALVALSYTVGLGVYVVASTRPAVPSEPRDAEQARAAVRALGIAETYDFAHGFVGTPHGRMHYAEAGAGPPVLCLHGNPTWSYLYRDFLRGLSDRARVIAPDLIGFGLSEKPADPDAYTIEGHIEDVSTLVRKLDLRDITLVVQDWGGPIGLGVAARHPDRIRAIVAMNTIGFPPDEPGSFAPLPLSVLRTPILGELLVQGFGIFHRVYLPAGIARNERKAPARLAPYRDVQDSWSARAGALAFPRLLPRRAGDPAMTLLTRTAAYLESYDGPLLLVWGMRDPVFGPDVLAVWRAHFPDAPVLELPDTSHFLQEDAPEQVVPRIAAFLDEIRAASPPASASAQ